VTISKSEKLDPKDARVRARVLERFRLGLKTQAPVGAGSYSNGSILLVGEQVSHPEANKYHAPFCSIKGCSGWLNALLEDAGIPEKKMFWVNALDNDGTEVNLRQICDTIEPCTVFALGNVARDQLRKQGITSFGHVPHPQYWKRFKSKQPYPLIIALQGIIAMLPK
jgi:hypothetical protein